MHKTESLKRGQAGATLQFVLGNGGSAEAPAAEPLPPFAAGASPLQLVPPDEPADVLFENLGVSRAEVLARRAALSLLLYAVIFGVFVAASIADTIQHEVEIRGECIECGVYDGPTGELLTPSTAQRARFEACKESGAAIRSAVSSIEQRAPGCVTVWCVATSGFPGA